MKKNSIAFYSIVTHIIFIMIFTIFMVQNKSSISLVSVKDLAASSSLLLSEKELENSSTLELLVPSTVETAPVSLVKSAMEIYDEMSIEELENALRSGTLTMQYSELYTMSGNRLSVSKGALYFNGHKETYYSEKVLPGTSLNIPGRHVADDGTIRDGDGYICVAADPGYYAKGSTLITSLGPAKVYDTGCDYGTIDVYVSW